MLSLDCSTHKLNMESDLQSLFGLLCSAVLIDWEPATPPLPPHFGSYTRALLVSQDRRHFFVTPWLNLSPPPLPHLSLIHGEGRLRKRKGGGHYWGHWSQFHDNKLVRYSLLILFPWDGSKKPTFPPFSSGWNLNKKHDRKQIMGVPCFCTNNNTNPSQRFRETDPFAMRQEFFNTALKKLWRNRVVIHESEYEDYVVLLAMVFHRLRQWKRLLYIFNLSGWSKNIMRNLFISQTPNGSTPKVTILVFR